VSIAVIPKPDEMSIPRIETPASPLAPEVNYLAPSQPIAPPFTRAVTILEPPKADDKTRLQNSQQKRSIATRQRRTTVPTQNFAGTFVSYLQVSLGGKRIAFHTDTGPPIRGSVDTELLPKLYYVKVNKTARYWEFVSGSVRIGVRFGVKLDGTDPFELNYPDSTSLIVAGGLSDSTKDKELNFDAVKTAVIAAAASNSWREAYEILDRLLEVDLYDVVDELWFDHSDIVRDLAQHLVAVWDPSISRDEIDFLSVLRCLESFTITDRSVFSVLYIDNFTEYAYMQTPWDENAQARAEMKLWNNRIILKHGGSGELAATRYSIVWLDDILDDDKADSEPPTYGSGALLYPKSANRTTTPRLYQAKKEVLRKLEEEAFASIGDQAKEAFVEVAVAIIFEAISIFSKTRLLTARPRSMTPISSAWKSSAQKALYDSEPGYWVFVNEPIKEIDAEYEAFACQKPKGWSYVSKINGKRWDGRDPVAKKLLDAKRWTDETGRGLGLRRGSMWWANKILEDANKGLVAAAGEPLQWRIAGKETAAAVKALLKLWEIDIEVIWFPMP
jgi:hypothetical protein